MAQPITLKFVLKGEVTDNKVFYQTESGEVLEYDIRKRILVPSKKNSQDAIVNKSTGKAYIIPSKQYTKWVADHLDIFRNWAVQLYERQDVSLPIVRCKIKILHYYPDSMTRDNHNKNETIYDML